MPCAVPSGRDRPAVPLGPRREGPCEGLHRDSRGVRWVQLHVSGWVSLGEVSVHAMSVCAYQVRFSVPFGPRHEGALVRNRIEILEVCRGIPSVCAHMPLSFVFVSMHLVCLAARRVRVQVGGCAYVH